LTRKKKEKSNKKQLEDNKLLELSETIINRAYSIDKWGRRLFKYFIITLFLYFYVRLFFINQPENDFIYENVLPLTSTILIYLSMIFLYSAFIIIGICVIYKERKSRTYDKKRVVQLYLKELNGNPNKERKREIIKHLTYNLIKLRDDFKVRFTFFYQYDWKQFFRININRCKFQYQVINKFSNFIENAIILLDINEYKDFINQVGDLILNEDFNGLNQLYKTNNELFNKVDQLKEDFNFTKNKKRIKQIKNLIEFTSNNYKFVIVIILILIFIYFVVTGEVSKIFDYLI
jgi:hypothetical protein